MRRYSADANALSNINRSFQTSGKLQRPLVTLHTTGDPIIPYWQELLYTLKTFLSGSPLLHLGLPVTRYGHCTFTRDELLGAFSVLATMAGRQ